MTNKINKCLYNNTHSDFTNKSRKKKVKTRKFLPFQFHEFQGM